MLNSQVDEIKNRLDIVEVLSGYLKLQKAGANFKASCPFHNEKTPSLMVSPTRQMWHCFGCGVGGDIFEFVMKIENIEFPDALRTLADKAGVALRQEDPRVRSEKTRLLDICEAVAKFFESQLGGKVSDYLKDRGLKPETIKEFRIGFAPDSWDSLLRILTAKGFKGAEIEKAGLVIKSEKGVGSRQYYDRFRSRIMFPVCNLSGQVVGFSGRIFGQPAGGREEAKYVNTPNTPLYDKSRILYGLDKAKNGIRAADRCFLVEGQMDLIMSFQDGVENACATSGTALTPDHLVILKRYTENLVLGFDMDEAGELATNRGIDLAMAAGFNIKIISLAEGPEGKQASYGVNKDPADFVKANPGKLNSVLDSAQPIMEYYFGRVFQRINPDSIDNKKAIAAALLPQIKKIYNSIEQAHWLDELARRLVSPVESLAEELKKISAQGGPVSGGKLGHEYKPEIFRASAVARPRQEMMAERLMSLVLRCPEHRDCLDDLEADMPVQFVSLCSELKGKGSDFSFEEFYKKLAPETQKKVDYLILKADYEAGLNSNVDFRTEAVKTVNEMNLQKTKEDLKRLEMEIQQAQKAGETGVVLSKTRDVQALMVKLANFNKNNNS